MRASEPADPKLTEATHRDSDPVDRAIVRELRTGGDDADIEPDREERIRRLAGDEADEEELAEEDMLADAEERGEGPDA
jgi:hypothetical protein